jgi:FKBP-type peptidyl-prolyl cis-trans isomerase
LQDVLENLKQLKINKMKAFKFFAIAAAVVAAVSCATSEVKVDVELPTRAEVDSVSYLLGVNYGMMFKQNGFAEDLSELDMALLKKGMEDALKAEEPKGYNDTTFAKQFKINPYDMNRILNSFLKKKTDYKAEVNRVKGEKFLASNALKGNVMTTESGLQYTILAEGSSEKVAKNDTVTVKYRGTLIDGTMFDEGEIPGHVSGSRGLITGFDEGIRLVGEGGKAIIYIPADLAYGSRGNRGIEPNSVLIFDIEVVKVDKFVAEE